jgi:hypothetical protein
MPAKQTIKEEVKMLLGQKGKTCVSIVVPLHNLTIDQKADKIHLEKAVKEVCERIKANNIESSDMLIEKLDALLQQAEFNRNDQGIGLYVSAETGFYSTFPFTVTENIVIDKSFRLRELLFKQQYSIPYNVLYIDESEIRLYTGKLRELKMVCNGEFPMLYEEKYEYQPASHSTSLAGYAHVKSFEKDKRGIDKIRHEAFIQQADDQLHKYLQNSEVLLLCGVTRYTSAFLNRTAHANKIISVLNGNYNRFDETEFAGMAWPSIEAYIDEQMIDAISEYNEKIGEGLSEEGFIPVWDAVLSGRGNTLLVERNYQVKAYLANNNSWQLFLQAPRRKHKVLEDAVNNLIEMVLDKNGKVVFTEDGMLNDHKHIALITRYHYFS